ncbi:PREDICTED: methyl-CpG-binding domain protein 1, partial [Sturnus vulgaris]|uniref:methyl-CpG-binding domain protein 1 n=1 Tax=Sturnus vulgaris TaxID=9172 RepID=UPI00071A7532
PELPCSPTGQKFRSKIELRRFLGPGHDLSNFDFKSGLQRPSPTRTKKGPKWHLPAVPLPEPPKIFKKEEEEEEAVGGAEAEKTPPLPQEAPPPSRQTLPIPTQAPPPPGQAPLPVVQATPLSVEATPPPEPPLRRTRKRPLLEPPQDGVVALCASCQTLFPGVSLPPQRRCRWLCPDCRAQRRDFNREQRFYKRVGCGTCQACRIPEDCGICSACSRSPPGGPSGPGRTPKCLLRRCLRIVKKKARVAKKSQSPLPLTEKWKPPVEREPSDTSGIRHRKTLTKGKEKKKPGRPPKPPGPRGRGVRSRASRRCGVCTACRRPADCGRCDFCRDKPKFGGQNLKRQKCRWRQCLRCAMPFPLPPAPQLWPGSFLEELAEIPLPAHWGVVGADGGPGPCPARGLRLVQRCPRSSMAAAAVLLNPGLAFRVLVARGRPVPPGHEVLARRPPLRSVLDLVELLCDLEAYGPCPGPPGPPGRPPAPRCHVLRFNSLRRGEGRGFPQAPPLKSGPAHSRISLLLLQATPFYGKRGVVFAA